MGTMTGRCACGAVRWSTQGGVTRNLACHCTDCQRATSSAFAAFVGLIPGDVQWQGEIRHFQSSPGTTRGFCPICGTRLYFRSDKWAGEIHIHAATLDDVEAYRPDRHVMCADAVAWLRLGDAAPRLAGFDAEPGEGKPC